MVFFVDRCSNHRPSIHRPDRTGGLGLRPVHVVPDAGSAGPLDRRHRDRSHPAAADVQLVAAVANAAAVGVVGVDDNPAAIGRTDE